MPLSTDTDERLFRRKFSAFERLLPADLHFHQACNSCIVFVKLYDSSITLCINQLHCYILIKLQFISAILNSYSIYTYSGDSRKIYTRIVTVRCNRSANNLLLENNNEFVILYNLSIYILYIFLYV